jgi:hypothetical protein
MRAVIVMVMCIVLAACSRHDSMFSMAPRFKANSDADEAKIEQCISSRWQNGTRDFSREEKGHVIRLEAQTFFSGVDIGVRLQRANGKTLVEYFERRYADPLYQSMVKDCLSP